ncbi:MAG TPA: hypothetical protein PK733_00135 [Clostridiales bacterium]|nr:hypothetical protein [Clostridiales bacterium]
MKRKTVIVIAVTVFVIFALTGCIPGDGKYTSQKPAGFFSGIWHGWVAPISLIIGLLDRNIRVYEPVNTGWLYDFGFYIAIISGFGGLSLFRNKKKKD